MSKLTAEQLELLYVEMLENEKIKNERERYCEHEDAGDRV